MMMLLPATVSGHQKNVVVRCFGPARAAAKQAGLYFGFSFPSSTLFVAAGILLALSRASCRRYNALTRWRICICRKFLKVRPPFRRRDAGPLRQAECLPLPFHHRYFSRIGFSSVPFLRPVLFVGQDGIFQRGMAWPVRRGRDLRDGAGDDLFGQVGVVLEIVMIASRVTCWSSFQHRNRWPSPSCIGDFGFARALGLAEVGHADDANPARWLVSDSARVLNAGPSMQTYVPPSWALALQTMAVRRRICRSFSQTGGRTRCGPRCAPEKCVGRRLLGAVEKLVDEHKSHGLHFSCKEPTALTLMIQATPSFSSPRCWRGGSIRWAGDDGPAWRAEKPGRAPAFCR